VNNSDLPASNRVMGFKTFGCAVLRLLAVKKTSRARIVFSGV